MSGGGGGQSTESETKTHQEQSQDYLKWLKPYALGYANEANDLSNREYRPYGGFFQNLTQPRTYDPYKVELQRRGTYQNGAPYTLGPNEYRPTGAINSIDYDRYQKLKAANPDFSPEIMNQTDFNAWKKASGGQDYRTIENRPFVMRDVDYTNHLFNKSLDARKQREFQTGESERLPPNAQKAVLERMKSMGYGDTGSSGIGGIGTEGGSLIDFMNNEMLGRNIAPWSNEQNEAMYGTANIARGNVLAGDQNKDMREWLKGLFTAQQGGGGENPYLQSVIDRAQGDQLRAWNQMIKPRLDSTFARSNAFGGSAWGQANAEAERAMGQELGRVSEDIRYKDYADQQLNKLRAAGILGGGATADSRYKDLAALSGVGEQRQGYAQNLMNESFTDWQAENQQPYTNLSVLQNMLQLLGSETGYSVMDGTETTKSSTSGGGGGDMLGGIASGLLGLASLPMGGGASLGGGALSSILGGLGGGGGGMTGYIPQALRTTSGYLNY